MAYLILVVLIEKHAFIQHWIVMNRQQCGLTGVGVEGSRLKCLLQQNCKGIYNIISA